MPTVSVVKATLTFRDSTRNPREAGEAHKGSQQSGAGQPVLYLPRHNLISHSSLIQEVASLRKQLHEAQATGENKLKNAESQFKSKEESIARLKTELEGKNDELAHLRSELKEVIELYSRSNFQTKQQGGESRMKLDKEFQLLVKKFEGEQKARERLEKEKEERRAQYLAGLKEKVPT
jgi:peptidoglycan hydrolase CwlO-like protein